MSKPYFLSRGGAHVGPFSEAEILTKLEQGEQQWLDYVYDEQLQDWIMLMEHPNFTEKFNAAFARPHAKPIPAPAPAKAPALHAVGKLREKEWFLLKEGNNYGPFSTLDIVQMLQEKTLFEFDYVWNQSMDAWKRVAETPEFAADRIRDLRTSADADVSEVFFRRRHIRASYGCSLIVHNNKSVFKGRALEISEGGAGLVVENSSLEPGQTLYLHFQPGDGVPPFNAVVKVVSKQWVSEEAQANGPAPVKYGVRFTSISQTVRESIRDFTQTGQKAAA